MTGTMWPLRPLSLLSGRNAVTLFEIRLENDFIVFRGNEHESAGQILKGHVVLCLSSPLKLDEVHLRLAGTLRLSWTQSKMTTAGLSQHKVDRTIPILQHRWKPFIGGEGKSVTLQAGNYEFPFDYTLPGDTAETLEGIPEASISYRLKARLVRRRFASNIHTYKHIRVIRTLEPAALEFLHAMSVENIWPNKVDYSIIVPQKAVVFGGMLSVSMRFTPLLKGLELNNILAKLIEVRECAAPGAPGTVAARAREYKTERQVKSWDIPVGPQHWHDTVEGTGQEGWLVEKKLELPKKLRDCVQDVSHDNVKIRHKLRLVIGLKNPDGHISELRATLPVSIFISPNMPLDEEGNLLVQGNGEGGALITEEEVVAPPGYGQHVLDQLYDDVVFGGFQTPENQSGANSPYYQQSASASAEDLTLPPRSEPDPAASAAALVSRLQGVSTNHPSRRNSVVSVLSSDARGDQSEPLSRQTSNHAANTPPSGRSSPEHVDETLALEVLNKVPSYATAVRTPARPRSYAGGAMLLPMYEDVLAAEDAAQAEASGPPSETSDGEDVSVGPSSPISPVISRARAASIADSSNRPHSIVGYPRPRTSRGGSLSGLSDALLTRLSGYGQQLEGGPNHRGYIPRHSMHYAA